MSVKPVRRRREAVDGVLLLDKPAGITSQTAVSRAKALYNAAKAGHTGTLDPMATGLLPIAFGEATKFSSALLDAGKGYLATVRLGVTTTTGDLEGEVVATRPVQVDGPAVEAVLTRFRGDILQTPPMYSALKRDGKPLYEYARAGEVVEREARAVTIGELVLVDFAPPDLQLAVRCSKGTYIRVLAEDIGAALGCGACLGALRRTHVGRFEVAQALDFETLTGLPEAERRGQLLPADAMLEELPVVSLDEWRALRISRGQTIGMSEPVRGLVRIYGPGERFLGVAEAVPGGALQPRRLVGSDRQNA